VARILRGFVAPMPTTGSREGVQALWTEMNDNINKLQIGLMQLVNTAMATVQAEADRRADAMFQKLAQMLETAPRNDKTRILLYLGADVTPGSARQSHNGRGG
jgi:hypothetical protein